METKSEKNTASKKFSFRKRRSSKGKKDETPPVDLETEQEATVELLQDCEPTQEKPSDSVEEVQSCPETVEDDSKATQSCGEDTGTKTSELPANESTSAKKRSKRRGLFKRSSKKSSEKVEDTSELKVKESKEEGDEGTSTSEAATKDTAFDVNSRQEQVVCDEQQPGEITDASDGEGYLSMGEASEAEGEALVGGKDSSVEADKGTKRKGFFKRGLSLKRRKSKKQTNESKDETVTSENLETEKEPTLETSIATVDIDESHKPKPVEPNEEISNESSTDEQNPTSAMAKKYPAKPPRKVSFIGPDGEKLDSSDDGDSPTEPNAETVEDSDEDTITPEDVPSEISEEVLETVTVPEVVVMSDEAGCSEPLAEADDDDLTEVSSMSSSLLASSSDAPDTISTSDASRLFVFTDTDDTGSRITLEGISEESEAESKPEIVKESENEADLKPEVASKEPETEYAPEDAGEEAGLELKPEVSGEKSENEATKLSEEGEKIEWEMVNRSYDMSAELQRVRKHTLFGVKRLCCSVM